MIIQIMDFYSALPTKPDSPMRSSPLADSNFSFPRNAPQAARAASAPPSPP
jgi:hypothetical protein